MVFTSDNGPWLHYGIDGGSAGPLRDGKGTLWEGGVRVPAIMRWPEKIPPDQVTSEIAANIDLYPTFARLAGVELPGDRVIDGKDLWPLVSRPGAKSPRDTYYYFAGQVFYKAEEGAPVNAPELGAVRHGRWKLFLEAGTPGPLYDLHSDVGENRDVTAWHPEVVERLRAMALEFNSELQNNIRPLGRRPQGQP